MNDRIHLSRMVFFGYHGVYPEETERGQQFIVDLTLTLDLAEAAATDRLEATVDYGAVHALCRRIVEHEKYKLIEALAGRISDQVLAGFPRVDEVTVLVRKPQVVLGSPLEHAAVELTRKRT